MYVCTVWVMVDGKVKVRVRVRARVLTLAAPDRGAEVASGLPEARVR